MNLQDIDERVEALDLGQGFTLIYDLLLAYGLPKASVSRLLAGAYDRAAGDREVLWKNKVYYQYVSSGEADLHSLIDSSRSDARIIRDHPRFLVVRDDEQLVAEDRRTGDTLDTSLTELRNHTAFFLPWAGIEKTQIENLNLADVKAAQKMARLYDEVIKHNRINTPEDVHHLNVFFSRLLFCFFAEDTEVFLRGQFTNAVGSLTQDSGADLHVFLDELFHVLDTDPADRSELPAHLSAFGFVNGKLFHQDAPAPKFSAKARRLVLECGTLDWSQINPDIFGSMIQAVVHPDQREGLGIHYTSVENIMKVVRPLFLDDLHRAFDEADNVGKLQRLLDRVHVTKVFDPACGSGNFLVIAYKELRRLEHQVLGRLVDLDPSQQGLFKLSGINLENFYGIEIDDFAHEIAILSLWLAKHQMNVEFKELFGVEISLIPLKDTGQIVCANATREDWAEVCPKTDGQTVYVLGNPPYAGSSMQRPEHKQDFVQYFGSTRYPKNLDYIALWFLKGSEYVADGRAELGFVTTNSVCQGDHVGLMWPLILERGLQISFAYRSFRWSNQAKGNAGVSVAIIGLAASPPRRRLLVDGAQQRRVENINPYLAASPRNTIVHQSRSSICDLPPMVRGSQPTDGGHLILSESEVQELTQAYPESRELLKRYMGSRELLRGETRYCLWIPDSARPLAESIPPVYERLRQVAAFRLSGSTTAQAMADRPHRFMQRPYRETSSIIVPGVSSERREYVPVGFLGADTVISNLANAIYDAEPWLFALVQSRMHMAWVRAVGGRLESRLRYSAVLCYNTFPVPDVSDRRKTSLTELVYAILQARENHPAEALSQLYDSDRMPPDLRRAHTNLDDAVDGLYRSRSYGSDEERLETLFVLYEQLTGTGREAINA